MKGELRNKLLNLIREYDDSEDTLYNGVKEVVDEIEEEVLRANRELDVDTVDEDSVDSCRDILSDLAERLW